MEPLYLPEFRDIRWRWIAYGASACVLAGVVFAFCHQVGLDYVSCSPYRVPIARLAAAQAALGKEVASQA